MSSNCMNVCQRPQGMWAVIINAPPPSAFPSPFISECQATHQLLHLLKIYSVSLPRCLRSTNILLVECRFLGKATDSWSEGRISIPGRSGGRSFSSALTFCADWFGVRSNPVLLQRHVKDPGHSAKSAGGRLHLDMHTVLIRSSRSELTMLSKHSVGNYEGNELKHNSSGTLDHCRISSLSCCGLILAYIGYT